MTMWNIEELTGYKPMTTFWQDFSIAERFGTEAIKDTYRRASEEWHECVEYFTELVMVLNWKLWYYYENSSDGDFGPGAVNRLYAELYNDLWSEADRWACEHFEGDDLAYFYRTTD